VPDAEKYKVTLRGMRDGQEWALEYEPHPGWDADSHDHRMRFEWEEGNFSCDCNRTLAVQGAGSDQPPRTKCGEDLIRCLSITNPAGETIYTESAPASP
jgi:hypothetical protein